MKRFPKTLCLLAGLALAIACTKTNPDPTPDPTPVDPVEPTASVESGISYQLLVYSFCDSDGDGCGDFKGIESKLDYLKAMGVQALWLSPIHPAASYHGYDVKDYSTVNPDYGTEADFKSLLGAAHAKDIKIYLDYVLNHTSKDHPWFLAAKQDPNSEFRDYYIFSDNPQADIKAGKIAMIAKEGAGGYDSGQWFQCVSGGGGATKVKFTLGLDSSKKPKTLTISKTEDISNTGTQNTGVYLYYGDAKMMEFYNNGGSYSVSLNLESDWGVLVRTSKTSWDGGTKYGAPSGKNQLVWDTALTLSNSDAQDILLPTMAGTWYHSHMWTSWFADLNYGSAETCENSPAFKAVCESADKWIQMGVDGFRLDAIKHIYHKANSDENPTFLKKFYDHCNSTYKSTGKSGDIYMVGEHFSEAGEVAPYYKGLPGFFEFSFWWRLKDAINSGNGSNFVGYIQDYQKQYAAVRSDYIEATKLSNHDEDRAGSDLGKNISKMKLAGAMLLTCSGEPYIYQGEELGYWGTKSGGDEYVRTPMLWTSDYSSAAVGRLGGKVDKSMLSASISVANQEKDNSSILNLYRNFGELRTKYKALAKGNLGYCPAASSKSAIAAWYREYDGQRVLVVHNLSGGSVNLTFASDRLDKMIGSNGTVTVDGSKLTIGAYGSAIFLQ